MLDEAPTVELITKVLIEVVCVVTMIAASDLDADAAVRPGKLLGCGNE